MSPGKKPTSQMVGSLWAVALWAVVVVLLTVGDELLLLSMGDELGLLVPLVPVEPDGM
jgi:hypothetical protein